MVHVLHPVSGQTGGQFLRIMSQEDGNNVSAFRPGKGARRGEHDIGDIRHLSLEVFNDHVDILVHWSPPVTRRPTGVGFPRGWSPPPVRRPRPLRLRFSPLAGTCGRRSAPHPGPTPPTPGSPWGE